MGVIYIDAFFIVNFIMNFIVMFITAKICDMACIIIRLVLSASAGALWAIICVVSHYGMISYAVMKCITYTAAVIIMIRIAFGKIPVRRILRTYVVMLCVSFTIAGAISAVLESGICKSGFSLIAQNWVMYAGIVLSAVMAAWVIHIADVKRVYGSGMCMVELAIEDKKYHLAALADTGNHLKDPVSGREVHVIDKSVLGDNIPKRWYFIPYHAVGTENGIIPVVYAQYMKVYTGGHTQYYDKPEIALYNGRVSSDREYDILLNAKIFS